MVTVLFLAICYGPGLLSIHGRCLSMIPSQACLPVAHRRAGARGDVCVYLRPPCVVTVEEFTPPPVPNGPPPQTVKTYVAHNDGACVLPIQFIMGNGQLTKVQNEIASEGERIGELLATQKEKQP